MMMSPLSPQRGALGLLVLALSGVVVVLAVIAVIIDERRYTGMAGGGTYEYNSIRPCRAPGW